MRDWGFWEYLWFLAAGFWGLLMWAAQVSPKQAASNVPEWAVFFGVRNPPKWLMERGVDRAVSHGAAAALALSLIAGMFLFFDVENMQLGPKILLIVSCLGVVSGIMWNFAQPGSSGAKPVARSTADTTMLEAVPLPQPAPQSAPALPPSSAPIAEIPTESPPPATLESSAPVPEELPRDVVDAHVTPEFLTGLFEGNTALRAQTLASGYIGKWMEVSGPLGEIHPGAILGTSRTSTLVVFSSPGQKRIYMWFSGEWVDQLALLSKNQNISVLGQIDKIEERKIELKNCELIQP